MKTFLLVALAALLSTLPALVSAFAPARICGSIKSAPIARTETILAAKPAKTKEQDLELTLAAIRRHIAAGDDDVVDDDAPAAGSEGGGEGKKQPLEKIKSIGAKVKSKGRRMKSRVKSKLGKGE